MSPELPFGEYVVIETTVPDGYIQADPFIVTIDDDSREAQPCRVIEDKAKNDGTPDTFTLVPTGVSLNHLIPWTGDGFEPLIILAILFGTASVAMILVGRLRGKKEINRI